MTDWGYMADDVARLIEDADAGRFDDNRFEELVTHFDEEVPVAQPSPFKHLPDARADIPQPLPGETWQGYASRLWLHERTV